MIMPNSLRKFSLLDKFCMQVDDALKVMSGHAKLSARDYPAKAVKDDELSCDQLKHSAGLMRVNHTGEVCAQALYQAQGLVSRNKTLQAQMQHAALEEGDHLHWCQTRLIELGSHTSYLNPLWFAGSFALGLTAGLIGDKWSLGFVAETETQVVHHLQSHLSLLPAADKRSVAILQQMQTDEAQHRDDAIHAGAARLPEVIKKLMRLSSKIMVKTAFWI
jgi:ubiquinone biosynthesis monooxygenase Coq7